MYGNIQKLWLVSLLFVVQLFEIQAQESMGGGGFPREQNFPNPFNPATELSFTLPKSEWVNLKIFNALGQQIKNLAHEKRTAGHNSFQWDGTNEGGTAVPGGTYFYRIVAADFSDTKPMLLIK